MNEKLKQLREQAAAKLAEAKALIATGRPEDLEKASKLNGEIGEIKAQIDAEGNRSAVAEAIKANSQWFDQPVSDLALPGDGGGAAPAAAGTTPAQLVGWQAAGKTWLSRARGVLEDEGAGAISAKQWNRISQDDYLKTFFRWLKVASKGGSVSSADMKVLQEGLDDQGGFLAPADVIMRMLTKQPAPTQLLSHANVVETNRDRIRLPKGIYSTDNKYTSPVRLQWVGEVPASSTAALATQPVFGEFECPVHTAMMYIPVTNDMLEDSGVAMMDYLGRCFSEAQDLGLEDVAINGTGFKQPSGILQAPSASEGSGEPVVVNSTAAAALKPAGLKALQYALPPQYQARARWLMNWTNCAQEIDSWVDGHGRYLWGQMDNGLDKSNYERPLLSRPVVFSEFMPNIGANAYPIVYGDLAAYTQVRRIGISIQILSELNALLNQKVLLARLRVGGDVAEDWALKIQKVAA